MKFYLGIHQPIWLTRVRDIPLLVSHRRLGHRRTLPRSITEWALDSGGFTELQLHGRWQTNEKDYVRAVRRYADEIGNLTWAAPQDWMCEQSILKRTGLTVREHQRRTVRNFVRLRELAPELPFVPVLQGWTLADYERCAELYGRAGVDLESAPLVGVGTVCRRQREADVERIMRAFATRNLNLHGFGVKLSGLNRYAEALSSSDSMSWSRRGRYVPGCTASHRTESNCLQFALSWHRRIQETLGLEAEAAENQPGRTLARAA
ncbi:deazapurine DNA modification protein DpdA family protein [Actinokineospora sp. NPDC004072]